MENVFNLLKEMGLVEKRSLAFLLNFKTEFSTTLNKVKQALPYNINLLDEAHANENAHSRILVRLLQYTENDENIFLASFLEYLGKPFSELHFINPEITAEKDRIDARVRDKSNSLIIENKVNYAVDQERQIERYIENELNDDYKLENIYVLYLTRSGGSPSEYSISGKEKKKVGNRYKEINYHDILGWLKNLPPFDKTKDKVLQGAIVQYQDYLEGLFFLREGELRMKNEMIDLIEKKLEFNNNETQGTIQKLEKLSDYYEYAGDLQNYFLQTKKELVSKTINTFKDKFIKENKFNFESQKNEQVLWSTNEYLLTLFRAKGWCEKIHICIEFAIDIANVNTISFYIGIKNFDSEKKGKILQEKFESLFKDGKEPTTLWPYYADIYRDISISKIITEIENGELYKKTEEKVKDILEKIKDLEELKRK